MSSSVYLACVCFGALLSGAVIGAFIKTRQWYADLQALKKNMLQRCLFEMLNGTLAFAIALAILHMIIGLEAINTFLLYSASYVWLVDVALLLAFLQLRRFRLSSE